MIVFGSGMYGKVDEVPGICDVRTRFGHLWWIPLIPMGSFVVFEDTNDGFRGADITLSGKSVLVAWARAACLVGVIVSVFFAVTSFGDQRMGKGAVFAVLAVMFVVALIWLLKSSAVNKASYDRAVRLADQIGVSPEVRMMIEVVYKRMTPEQADAALAAIEQQSAAPSSHVPTDGHADGPSGGVSDGNNMEDQLRYRPPGT